MGNTIRRRAPSRLQPSTIAASSSSAGTDLKNPISSQVQNGMVNDGYTKIRAQKRSCKWSAETTRASGMNSKDGGTR